MDLMEVLELLAVALGNDLGAQTVPRRAVARLERRRAKTAPC